MAPRAGRSAPKKKAGENDQLTPEQEGKLIREVFDYIKGHKKKQSSFREKMKLNWEQNVVAHLKLLGMTQADAMEEYGNHQIETGKDENSVERAEAKRARSLNTRRRIYAALHDGKQLNFIEMQELDEKHRREAEDMADAPVVKEDGAGGEEETEE